MRLSKISIALYREEEEKFLSFSTAAWITLSEISNTILNKSVKSEHFCVVLHLKQNTFRFFLFSMISATYLLYVSSVMLRYDPCILSLLGTSEF